MFGTYAPEEETPVYGITTPLRSWNPVWANVHYWVDLARHARGTRRLADKVRVFLAEPGWRPDDLGGYQPAPEVDPRAVTRFDFTIPAGLRAYAFVQFLVVLGLGAAFLFV